MSQDLELEPSKIEAVAAWVPRWSSILALPGPLAELGLAPGETRAVSDADLRADHLPAECAAFFVPLTSPGASGVALWLLPREAARLLAAGEARDDDESLSDDDRDALGKLVEAVGSAFTGSLEPFLTDGAGPGEPGLDVLKDASWESGTDHLAPGGFVLIDLEITLGEATLPSSVLLSRPFVGEAWVETPPDEDGGSRPLDLDGLVSLASDEMRSRVDEALGINSKPCGELSDLLGVWRDGEVSGAVVEVKAGEESVLEILHGLRALPGCAKKAIVVLLEEPTSRNVVRCGQLGLLTVLGTTFEPDQLRDRVR